MDGIWPELALVAALIVVNALLAGTEIALISLREPKLTQMEESGGSAAVAARLARNPNRFLATIQIGITLAGFLASAVAAVTLAQPLVPVFSVFGDAAETVAVIVVTLVLAFVTLVFGELAPKRLALQRSESWAVRMGWPLHVFAVAMTPFVWLLSVATDGVVRLFGGEPGQTSDEIDLAELRDLIIASDEIPEDHQDVVLGAFEVADRSIGAVMTPRPDVITLEAGSPVDDAVNELVRAGFSRAPVVTDEGLDGAIGVASLRDLVGAPDDAVVGGHVMDVPALPETVTVLTALRTLQSARRQMAFVIDEHGGVEGIVTVEDLVEELVGEIYDEADRDAAAVRRTPDGGLLVPGRFPIHDLEDLGVHVDAPSDDVTTTGGLVTEALGRVAVAGDSVELGDTTYTVLTVRDRAIDLVRIDTSEESPAD